MAFSNAHFGAGIGSQFLAGVQCIGSEENLIDCTSSSVICFNGHNEDAGVRCQGEGKKEKREFVTSFQAWGYVNTCM